MSLQKKDLEVLAGAIGFAASDLGVDAVRLGRLIIGDLRCQGRVTHAFDSGRWDAAVDKAWEAREGYHAREDVRKAERGS